MYTDDLDYTDVAAEESADMVHQMLVHMKKLSDGHPNVLSSLRDNNENGRLYETTKLQEVQAEPIKTVPWKSDAIVETEACLFHTETIQNLLEHRPRVARHKTRTPNHMSCASDLVALELQEILKINARHHKECNERTRKITEKIGKRLASIGRVRKIMESMHERYIEMAFDSFIGVAILANAIFIGLSMDAEDPGGTSWLIVEWAFAILFWIELCIKLCLHGWRKQYCGNEACSNIFDAVLIGADTLQLFIIVFFKEQGEQLNSTGFSASLFRVVRLLRLTRILRLLQSHVFRDLVTMIYGMMGGLATLAWSVVLFVIFIYVVALIFRDSLGPSTTRVPDERIERYFANVPRSMFTIFRCSFGDCSTGGGTPIFEHVTEVHGYFWSLVYSGYVFIVVIGLFNVISAIFVENTMNSAAKMASRKRRDLLESKDRWATNVCDFLQALFEESQLDLPDLNGLEESECDGLLSEIQQVEFPNEVVDKIVHNDHRAKEALNKLDIDPIDHAFLADILDPQNDGNITVLELIDGLKRLRGEPRRSDIITIDLMVRSLQERIDEIWKWTHHSLKQTIHKSRSELGAVGVASGSASSFMK